MESDSARTSFHVLLTLPYGEKRISVGRDQYIWDAANSAGITLPAICHQGRCLTCAGLLEGAGQIDQSDSVGYYPQDKEAGYVLLCTGKPRTDLRIRTNQQTAMRKHRLKLGLPAPYSWVTPMDI
ncbi:MAG TPA: 2Fe-2S iron-sulfur cluster-binding protein [Clostridia bacterium]|nr:2Fe-2S iron-sulfur cluster-binding protein [Clostridia bacterium]